MKRLLLIDGNSLFHRAYHALPPITDRSGEVANAVFGFSNMLLKVLNEIKPTHVACAFDTEAPTFRHIEFEEYKATRPAPPADLYPQLPKVKKVLDAFGIGYFEKEGYEADDLIATLATQAMRKTTKAKRLKSKKALDVSRSSFDIVILSGDRDCLQLVDDGVKVQMPSFTSTSAKAPADKKAMEGKTSWGVLVGTKEVREKYGLQPAQMVDYKSLVGDVSDNVLGISGIGPRTAAQLLQKYKTLENLFKHLKEIPESVRRKLESGRATALTAQRLVELDKNISLKFKIENLRFRPNWDRVRQEYERLGFKSIVAKLPDSRGSQIDKPPKKGKKMIKNKNKKNDNQSQLELM